jgi:hypothetical protein
MIVKASGGMDNMETAALSFKPNPHIINIWKTMMANSILQNKTHQSIQNSLLHIFHVNIQIDPFALHIILF